jgi:hypothetical protein
VPLIVKTPPAELPDTPEMDGVKVTPAPVPPPVTEYVIGVIAAPLHIVWVVVAETDVNAMTASGSMLTTKGAEVEVHPFRIALTVYVPAATGMEVMVAPVDHSNVAPAPIFVAVKVVNPTLLQYEGIPEIIGTSGEGLTIIVTVCDVKVYPPTGQPVPVTRQVKVREYVPGVAGVV